jgi:hypothetical protein
VQQVEKADLGEGPSADAMTPLVFAILKARTPNEIETTLIDERIEPLRTPAPIVDARYRGSAS